MSLQEIPLIDNKTVVWLQVHIPYTYKPPKPIQVEPRHKKLKVTCKPFCHMKHFLCGTKIYERYYSTAATLSFANIKQRKASK